MSVKELVVYRKSEELLYKIYPRLINYPKAEKFALCQTIKEHFFELLKYISLGNSVKSKRKTYLQEADGHLQVIKVLMTLSKKRRYISKGFYREVSIELTEINKILWINTVGFKIHATHRLLRNKSKKKIKRKCKKMRKLIIEGDMTKEKAEQILNSWKGHADHANSENFYRYLENRFDYIYRDENESFKIKEEVALDG